MFPISDSNQGASGSSSPSQGEKPSPNTSLHSTLRDMLSKNKGAKSALSSVALLSGFNPTPVGMKNSLFDEGLRIAQQYGLGDFAEELKTLQGGEDESENEGGSDEKNTSHENGTTSTTSDSDVS